MQHFIFSLTFIILSFLLLANPFDTHQSNAKGQGQKAKLLESKITTLAIPSLQLLLPIQTAIVENDEWLITDDITAYHGEGTALPGKKGPMVIFAHARPGLFSQLPLLEKGDRILIKGERNTYVYTIETKEIVSPENISFLQNDTSHHIALFTCFGPNDEKRILFLGTLEHVMTPSQKHNVLYDA